MVEGQTARKHRKERTGEVVSDKMDKTIVVRVERRFRHPKFKKVVTQYKKFYAHDEKEEAKIGDVVRIEETRPLSKSKSWRLVEVVDRLVEGDHVVLLFPTERGTLHMGPEVKVDVLPEGTETLAPAEERPGRRIQDLPRF